MYAYLVLTTVLLLLAYVESASQNQSKMPLLFACVILILFVGLRFETGADWVEYELLMQVTDPLFTEIPRHLPPNFLVEPGFSFLVSSINSLGLTFQFLLFFCAAFSIGVLAIFFRLYSSHPTSVLIWYCGFALLIGQMAALRQVVAYSFLLLSFLAFDRGRLLPSIALTCVAISMHVFAAVLAPLVYLRYRPPPSWTIAVFCSIGLVATFAQINLFALFGAPAALIFGQLAEIKIEGYSVLVTSGVTTTSLVLAAWHLAALYLLNRSKLPGWSSSVVRLAIYATIWSLVAHTYLALQPAVWNRLMLLTLPLQALALIRCYADRISRPDFRFALPTFVWAISTASIVYTLTRESALPYLPYQSAVYVWATGDVGTGRIRYQIEQANLDRRVEESGFR